jgi:hypothetical protein
VFQRIILAGLAVSMSSRAETFTGRLVDARCYESRENNKSPNDTLTYADRDRNEEILYCAPTPKTKAFTVVDPYSDSFKLDPSGNLQAADLVRKAGKKRDYVVTVNGEKEENTVRVLSISLGRAAASGKLP